MERGDEHAAIRARSRESLCALALTKTMDRCCDGKAIEVMGEVIASVTGRKLPGEEGGKRGRGDLASSGRSSGGGSHSGYKHAAVMDMPEKNDSGVLGGGYGKRAVDPYGGTGGAD